MNILKTTKSRLIIAGVIVLLLAACATTGPFVIGFSGEKIYKNEIRALPDDFPDELFLAWFSKPCELALVDFNDDGIADNAMLVWFDDAEELLAVCHADITDDGSPRMWGFVEFIDGRACIVWIAKDAEEWQLEIIHGAVNGYNTKNII